VAGGGGEVGLVVTNEEQLQTALTQGEVHQGLYDTLDSSTSEQQRITKSNKEVPVGHPASGIFLKGIMTG
jgi:hypothetical protein